MFPRSTKYVFYLLSALILSASCLVPKQVQAQELEYVPLFKQIETDVQAAQSDQPLCISIAPLDPVQLDLAQMAEVQQLENMNRVPFAQNFRCELDLTGVNGATGIEAADGVRLIVPYEEAGKRTFRDLRGPVEISVDVPLNPDLSPAFFEEAMQGDNTGYSNEILAVYYMGQESVSTAEGDNPTALIPPAPFGGPESLFRVLLTTLTKLYKEKTNLRITPEMQMYKCPGDECEHATLATICPGLTNYEVLFKGSFPTFRTVGNVTTMKMWTLIGHINPDIAGVCPSIVLYRYLDGPTTWSAVVDQDVLDDVAYVVEQQKAYWRRQIVLNPIGGGQLLPAPASFDSLDAGEVSLIGITVATLTAILKFIAVSRGAPAMP